LKVLAMKVCVQQLTRPRPDAAAALRHLPASAQAHGQDADCYTPAMARNLIGLNRTQEALRDR
jgi:hypothetical protein